MEIPKLIQNDPWLAPYEGEIAGRYRYFLSKENQLTRNKEVTLVELASGYLYFGLHKITGAWVFREWAPNATEIFLIGDFNEWQRREEYRLQNLGNGIWELYLREEAIHHEDLYKLMVHWDGDCGERIPAWSRRVIQDNKTHIFCAQVWQPKSPYQFKITDFKPNVSPLLIYECHIGMSSEEGKVNSYEGFRINILPRIVSCGYNTIQIMAIQEHPYYGSFGYHVSSFFAASSRFGTPEELKRLIDEAHSMGIAVIMDIVHSHAVKNETEGLGRLDGSYHQYFHGDHRREHPAWDSLCFNYAKNEVLHFLLSNCKFWLEEYQFDGFRFDGVTSMLYYSHGLEETFTHYGDYYNGNQDMDAICYLSLANKLIHEVKPHAITIAEEVSGMPGLALKTSEGGFGFDYRMAMNIPDFWIKIIKEKQDQDWQPTSMWWELTNRRHDEKTISYAESHDQALVGDKTIIFRLIDAKMYWHMTKDDNNLEVSRGIALHKMIRFITLTTINGGYLNFMGNEFGHPEWIDFPRLDNGWSYHYARRQWNLAENPDLKYHYLSDFDKAMIQLVQSVTDFQASSVIKLWDNDGDQVLAYQRGDLIFVFNFNPEKSYSDYGILCSPGEYKSIINTDSQRFGGFGSIDENVCHFTHIDPLYVEEKKEWLKLYLPARTAIALKKQ